MPFPFRGLRWPIGVAALCLVGCGGHASSSKSSASTVVTTTPAAVSSVSAPTPLLLVRSTPAAGSLDVRVDASVVLEFDAALDLASVPSSVFAESRGRALSIAATASDARLTIRPQGAWPEGEAVALTVTSRLRARSGAEARVAQVRFQTFRGSSAPDPLALSEARSLQASVRLQDGRILSAGGLGAAPSGVCEVFDPDSASLAAVGSLSVARSGHSATLLQDGRVLVAGGQGSAPLRGLELYDPVQGAWRTLRFQLRQARQGHQAFLLPSGQVAFVGGWDAPPQSGGRALTSIELFDPSDESVRAYLGPPVTHAQWAQLLDGRLLNLADGELLDLAGRARTPIQSQLQTPRERLALTRLRDGKLFLAGGASQSGAVLHDEVEVFDPATLSFTSLPPLALPRAGARALPLSDGRVAIVGGETLPGGESVELYDLATGASSLLPTPPLTQVTAESLPEGGFVVLGARAAFDDDASSHAAGLLFRPAALRDVPRGPELVGLALSGAPTSIHPAGALELRFSEAVSPASLGSGSVLLTDPQGRVHGCALALDASGARLFVTPRAALTPGTDYLLEVAGLELGGTRLARRRFALTTRPQSPLGEGALLIVDETSTGDVLLAALDRNRDGDFEDADELQVLYRAPAGSPLGAPAQGLDGSLYVPDESGQVLLRLRDLDGDGAALAPGEATPFFGTRAGTLQEPTGVAIDPRGRVFLADEGPSPWGDKLWKLEDLDRNGSADDTGEGAVFNDTSYAGRMEALRFDLGGRLWHLVRGPGSQVQVYRHQDLDGDGTSDSASEREALATRAGVVDVVTAPRAATWEGTAAPELRLVARTSWPTLLEAGGLAESVSATAFLGRRLLVVERSGRIWSFVDEDRDGTFDGAQEGRVALPAGRLVAPKFAVAGQAPARALWGEAPSAGATEVEVRGTPGAKLLLETSAGLLSGRCDAEGRARVALASPLQAGERLLLRQEVLGSASPAREGVVR